MGGRVKILSQFCLLRWRWCCQRTEGVERGEEGGHGASVVRVTVVAKTPQDSLRLLHVARCRVYFCCVCKVMELVCIDFAVAGGLVGGGNVAQVDCQGKVFSIFRIFIAPQLPLLRATLPVDKLFSFCAASRFLMPPTSQTVAAPLPFPILPPFPLGAFCSFWCCKFFNWFSRFCSKAKQRSQGQLDLPQLAVCVCFFLLFSGNVAPTTCAPCCSGYCCFSCCLDASLCAAIHRKV